jgi:hypothetical protein
MTILLRSLRRLFKPTAGDDLEQRHAESLAGVIDDDNFAARNHRAVHDDVDRITDPLIKRDNGAPARAS